MDASPKTTGQHRLVEAAEQQGSVGVESLSTVTRTGPGTVKSLSLRFWHSALNPLLETGIKSWLALFGAEKTGLEVVGHC